MVTIIRKPRDEPPSLDVIGEAAAIQHIFDHTFPAELTDILTHAEFDEIMSMLDVQWVDVEERQRKVASCQTCLSCVGCLLCLCTACLSWCPLCCYSCVADNHTNVKKLAARAEIKRYLEEQNKVYADRGVKFFVSPTANHFYVEIRTGAGESCEMRRDDDVVNNGEQKQKENGQDAENKHNDLEEKEDHSSSTSSSSSSSSVSVRSERQEDQAHPENDSEADTHGANGLDDID